MERLPWGIWPFALCRAATASAADGTSHDYHHCAALPWGRGTGNPGKNGQTLPACNTTMGASHRNHPQTANCSFVRMNQVGFSHWNGRSATTKPFTGIPLSSLPDFLQYQKKCLKCYYEGKPSFNCNVFWTSNFKSLYTLLNFTFFFFF